jgi:CheY-like chemotaxis protein
MSKGKEIILMADDDLDDRTFAKTAFERSRPTAKIHFVEDGEELLDYLTRRGPYADPARSPWPDLVLLDLNMPKKTGYEILQEIRSNPRLKRLPVVVFTTSQSEADVVRCYELGSNSFITKPATFEKLVEATHTISKYWLDTVELP